MAIENFIPVVWHNILQTELQKVLAFKNLTNSNIIIEGDTAKVISVTSPNVNNYDGSDITFGSAQDSEITFTLDQKKENSVQFLNTTIAKVKDFNQLRNTVLQEMAYKFGDTIDQYIASFYGSAGITGGSGNSAIGTASSSLTITSDGASSSVKPSVWFGRVARRLKDNNVPMNNVRMVVPPWFVQMMIREKLAIDSLNNNDALYVSGVPGYRCFGMTLYESNNVYNASSKYYITICDPKAIAFFQQINEISSGTVEKNFAQYVKMLMVYGAKVVRPDHMALSVVTEGTT